MFNTRISLCVGVSLEVRFCLLWEHKRGDNLVTILSLFLAKSVGKVNEKGQGTLVTLLEVGMLRIE